MASEIKWKHFLGFRKTNAIFDVRAHFSSIRMHKFVYAANLFDLQPSKWCWAQVPSLKKLMSHYFSGNSNGHFSVFHANAFINHNFFLEIQNQNEQNRIYLHQKFDISFYVHAQESSSVQMSAADEI